VAGDLGLDHIVGAIGVGEAEPQHRLVLGPGQPDHVKPRGLGDRRHAVERPQQLDAIDGHGVAGRLRDDPRVAGKIRVDQL